jgi:hypothetical protein
MKKTMGRREFVKRSLIASAVAIASNSSPGFAADGSNREVVTAREYLKEILYTREDVDSWLSGKAFPFAKYDGELGWLLPNAHFRDGVDRSVSTYTYGEFDQRITINYRDKPCRINTYGDSFTQCHQVSDGETWQEVLAAHIQEPVRNFGVGGWSVYQAYLRMLREESRVPADYIIFNIYDDDHFRNLDSWRNIRVRKHIRFIEPTLPYIKANAHEGTFEQCPNPCPTRESVYNLCDLEWAYRNFKDDFVLQIMLARANSQQKIPPGSYPDLAELATAHGIKAGSDGAETLEQTAERLHQQSALFASRKIVEKIEKFAAENGKKVLYVVSYPAASIARFVQEGQRWDQPFVDFLKNRGLPFVDLMEAHVAEFAGFKLGIKEYLDRYFIGHYNPRGNLFCAFALKDRLVEFLAPKPFPYRENVIRSVLE